MALDEASRKTGLSTCYLSLLENNKRKLFRTNTLFLISKHYKLPALKIVKECLDDEK